MTTSQLYPCNQSSSHILCLVCLNPGFPLNLCGYKSSWVSIRVNVFSFLIYKYIVVKPLCCVGKYMYTFINNSNFFFCGIFLWFWY